MEKEEETFINSINHENKRCSSRKRKRKTKPLPSMLTGVPDDDDTTDIDNNNNCEKVRRLSRQSSESSCDANSSGYSTNEYYGDIEDSFDGKDGKDLVDGIRCVDEVFDVVNGKPVKKRIITGENMSLPYAVLHCTDVKVHLTPDSKIPEKILCLDGGGVKGIVEAVALKYLQYALEQHHVCGSPETVIQSLTELIAKENCTLQEKEDNKIHDHDYNNTDDKSQQGNEITPQLHKIFDIITGTSTGSIIASAIARLHWKPDMLIKTSKEIAPIVFPKPSRWNFPARLKNSLVSGLCLFSNRFSRYSATALEKYLEEKLGNVEWKKQDENEPKFGIVAINKSSAQVHVFDSTKYKELDTVRVHEAVRASTAAPTYFSCCKIKEYLDGRITPTDFVDGGLAANCPANYTMNMMESYNLGCLISIGCGDSTPAKIPVSRVFQLSMNNEQCWQSFWESHPNERESLFRLTPSTESGIGSYDLADSHKVDEMEKAYVNSLCNNNKDIEKFKDASTCLFAKSIHVISSKFVEVGYYEYQFELVVKTTYNNQQYQHTDDLLEDRKTKNLSIDRTADGLKPLILQAQSDPENDVINITYDKIEVVGSPLRISKKIKRTRAHSECIIRSG